MAAFDTLALAASIRKRAGAPPSSTPGYDDQSLLDAAFEELISKVALALVAMHQEFFVTTKDVPLAAGQASYEVPSRAVLNELRELQLVDGNGKVTDLKEQRPEDLDRSTPTTPGTPTGYRFQGDSVVLTPVPGAVGCSLRFTFARRPSRLVLPTATMKVTSVTGAGTILNGGALPGTITNSTPCDLVKGNNPFNPRVDDVTPSATGGTSATFASAAAIPGAVAGDYLCLAGETPFPQLPVEWHAVLAQRTANKLMKDRGDHDGLAEGREELKELLANIGAAASERNEGAPVVLNAFPLLDD